MSAQKILFFTHEVKAPTQHKEIIQKWLVKTAGKHGRKIDCVQIIFCSDEYLKGLGKQFLNHDYFTDIVTFHYEETDKPIDGELYISIDRIRENARRFKVKTEQEKRRVIIHGLLHLLGFEDQKEEEKLQMTMLENKYLQDFDKMLDKSST